jgi:hypothetical protein
MEKEQKEGLPVKIIDCGPIIGRGIAATEPFNVGDWVMEYRGDLLWR